MTEHATERVTVAASADRCFDVLLDFARYHEWAQDIKEATVIERDGQGRGTKVAFRAAAMGRSASYVLAYDYSLVPLQISWSLVDGDIMRALDGSYRFTETADRSTEIVYQLSIELVVPIPGFVKRRAETKIVSTALRELKRRVESLATAT